MNFRLLCIKRRLESTIMFPVIMLGRLVAKFHPLKDDYIVFYFFPFYHTGGAEKIHALITQYTAREKCLIVFTRKSQNETFLKEFQKSGCDIRDISMYTDNKWIYFVNILFRGVVSEWINRQKRKPVVFNGQSNFAYKLSPWLKDEIRQVELIHSLNSFSYIRIPFLPFITKTVMISRNKIAEHRLLYTRYRIPEHFLRNIHYIPNTSDFENISVTQKDFSSFKVLYSGRGTPEKRPELVAAIAEEVNRHDSTIEFIMAGDEFEVLKQPAHHFIQCKGNISDRKELQELYLQCHILLITSSTEGFPLAVIEGMAYGCIIVATPVGDIPLHVLDGENGFLVENSNDEKAIIAQAANFILRLRNDRQLLEKMSAANICYAQQNFAIQKFGEAYSKLIYD